MSHTLAAEGQAKQHTQTARDKEYQDELQVSPFLLSTGFRGSFCCATIVDFVAPPKIILGNETQRHVQSLPELQCEP